MSFEESVEKQMHIYYAAGSGRHIPQQHRILTLEILPLQGNAGEGMDNKSMSNEHKPK